MFSAGRRIRGDSNWFQSGFMERRKAGMERIRGAAVRTMKTRLELEGEEKKKRKEKPSLIACSCGSVYPSWLSSYCCLIAAHDDQSTASPFRTNTLLDQDLPLLLVYLYIYIYISLNFTEAYFNSRKKFYRCRNRGRRVFVHKFQLLARQWKLKLLYFVTMDSMDL